MAFFVDSAVDTTRTTVASATYTDKISKAVAVVSGTTYAISWNCMLDETGTTDSIMCRMFDSTGSVTLAEKIDRQGATDIFAVGGVVLFTAASTGNNTFNLQFARVSGTTTVGCKEARFVVFALEAGIDFWASSLGQSSTATTAYTSKITMVATPTGAEDYLLLVSYDAEKELQTKMNDGADFYFHDKHDYTVTTGWNPGVKARQETLSAAKTYDLQYASATGTSIIRNAYLIAIKLRRFTNWFYAESLAQGDNATTTFSTRATVTATVTAVQHWVLCIGEVWQSTAGAAVYKVQGRQGGTNLALEADQGSDASTYKFNWIFAGLVTPSAGSVAFDTQWARIGAAGTASILNNVVVGFDPVTRRSGMMPSIAAAAAGMLQ